MPKQNLVKKKKIQDHLAEWKTANECIDIFSTKCKDHRGPLRSVEELDRLAKSYSDKYIYIYIYIYILYIYILYIYIYTYIHVFLSCFLSFRTFTLHKTAGKEGDYPFISSLPLALASETLRH